MKTTVKSHVKATGSANLGTISYLIAFFMIFLISASVAFALSSVTVTAPNGGEWSGTQAITWSSTDCVAGDKVNIYYGVGGTVGFPTSQQAIVSGLSAVECSLGAYSWNTGGKADGSTYQIKVSSKDDSNIFDYSDNFFTIDNTNPTVPATTLTSPNGGEKWAGGSSHEITWNSASITDTNLGATPITLLYSINGVDWTTITTIKANNGSYSWSVPSINSANVVVKITATDLAGNSNSDVSDAVFTIDSVAPTTTDDKTSGWYTASPVTITLTPSDPAPSSGFAWTKYCTGESCDPATGIDYVSPVQISGEGTHFFRYASMDNAGNTQATVNKEIKIDTIDPVVTINPVTTPTNLVTQTITGTYTETNINTIFVNGVAAIIDTGAKTYSAANVPLAEGSNIITTTATDLAGRTGTATTTIIKDTVNPGVSAGADKTTNAAFTQDASASDDRSGIASYSWTKVSGPGDITFGTPNAEDTIISASMDGTYVIRLTVTDKAGNSASDDMNLIWDTTAPSITTISSPVTSISQTFSITYTASDGTGSGVDEVKLHYRLNGGAWTPYNDYLAGAGTISFTAPAAGNYDFYIQPKDKVGNENSAQTPISSTEARSDIVYVDNDYTSSSAGGHVWDWDAFNTIQAGIDAVATGGTVNVAAGTYIESVTANRAVSIVGKGNTATIIQPAVDQDAITITADDVLIKDVKISTSNTGVTPNIAIKIQETDNVEINNNVIETTGNKSMGIWIGGSSNSLSPSSSLRITKNKITINGEATGIYAAHSNPAHSEWIIGGSSAEDANTIIANNGNPVELYDVSDSEVGYNTLTTSAFGGSNVIWSSELSNITNLVFNNNAVTGSGGSQVAFLTDFPVVDTTDTVVTTVTITGNTFSNWGSRALRIGDGDGTDTDTVTGVTINSNTFNMNTDTEVIGGTATDKTGTGNTFNVNSPAKIQKAMDSAFSGDNVNVGAGTYNEDVLISKSLTLKSAAGKATTIINGQNTGYTGAVLVAASNVIIGGTNQGFTIDGAGQAAIYIDSGTSNGLIQDNIVNTANGKNALLTEGGVNDYSITGNLFGGAASQLVYVNGQTSVHNPSTNIDFIGNTFAGTATGPALGQEATGSDISGNTFTTTTSYTRLELWGATNAVSGNTFNGALSGSQLVDNTNSLNMGDVLTNNVFDQSVVIDRPGNSLLHTVWSNIQDAINAATTGDAVKVSDGTYNEQLNINKQITLISNNGASNTTINKAVKVSANDVTLTGFKITPSAILGEIAGVYLQGDLSDVIVNKNEIDGQGVGSSRCVLLTTGTAFTNVSITGNEIHDCTTGIYTNPHTGVVSIENNEIYNTVAGIGGITGASVRHNTFHGNTEAIGADNTYANVVIELNKFLDDAVNNYGIIPVVAENNWWGTIYRTVIATMVSGNVDYTPWAYNSNVDIDNIEPKTTDDAPANWQNANVVVTLTPTDTPSGVAATYYCVDQANTCTPATVGTSVTVSTEGINYVRYYSTDKAGNAELVKSTTVSLDKTTPSTGDNVPSGWQNASFTITLTPSNDGKSPTNTYYTTDGTDPTVLSPSGTTISIDVVDGIYTIKYFTKDEAGNTETVKTALHTAKLDTVKPTSSATSPAYDNAGTIPVSFTASDTLSSVASTALYYRVDTGAGFGAWVDSSLEPIAGTSGTFNFDPAGSDGTYEFYTRATDNAGNVETKTVADDSTIFDDTLPEITSYVITNQTFSPNGDGMFDTTKIEITANELVKFNVEIRDKDNKEVKSFTPTNTTLTRIWDGKGTKTYNDGVVVADGSYVVVVKMTDMAGNIATITLGNITVDNTAPIIADVIGNVNTKVGVPTTITATITDGISDVSSAALHYTLPGGVETTVAMVKSGDTYTATISAIDEHGTITYYITATDSVSNTGTSANYSVKVYDFILELKQGWNQISVPKAIDSASDERLMNYLVYGYVPVERSIDGKWICNQETSCGAESATLDTVKPIEGYFVLKTGAGIDRVGIDYDTTAGTIPAISTSSIKLNWGWNLVGYGCETAGTVSARVPASTFSAIDEIAWYDTTKYISNIANLEPGKGYWALIAKKDTNTDLLWTSVNC